MNDGGRRRGGHGRRGGWYTRIQGFLDSASENDSESDSECHSPVLSP